MNVDVMSEGVVARVEKVNEPSLIISTALEFVK
jgi:hypothetical protein